MNGELSICGFLVMLAMSSNATVREKLSVVFDILQSASGDKSTEEKKMIQVKFAIEFVNYFYEL